MSSSEPARMLLAVAAVVVLARGAGWLLGRIGQPVVIGELVVGIVVGPTVLGGRLGRAILPLAIRPDLSLLGTLGVILLTWLVALRLAPEDHRELRLAGRIAAGSMLVPLAAGAAVGALLAGRYRPAGIGEAPFVLFVGAATAITAFPVLARILSERGWETRPVGRLALTTAAAGDLVTWLLVAAVLALAGAQGSHPARLWLLVPYLTALLLVRAVVGRRRSDEAQITQSELALLLAGAVASAAVTDWIGVQTIFGAFAFGLTVPRDRARAVARRAEPAIEPVVTIVLLPIYFVLSGLRVDLSHLNGAGLLALGLIGLAAIGGKLVGVVLPARLQAMSWRDGVILAVLLDTRGLTEIIVLTLGLQQHIIGPGLFSLMIVMAIGTTLITGPALNRLTGDRRPVGDRRLRWRWVSALRG